MLSRVTAKNVGGVFETQCRHSNAGWLQCDGRPVHHVTYIHSLLAVCGGHMGVAREEAGEVTRTCIYALRTINMIKTH